ncbi:MAG: DUF2934 domain-containing protein [Methylococcaceae bacterium]|nr:DUF2934 domain-containing protein [Methylococcaceae bacterium]
MAINSREKMTTDNTNNGFSLDTESQPNSSLHARIAVAAYYKAELRAFCTGHDLDDWLEAEQDVLSREGMIHNLKPAVKETASNA